MQSSEFGGASVDGAPQDRPDAAAFRFAGPKRISPLFFVFRPRRERQRENRLVLLPTRACTLPRNAAARLSGALALHEVETNVLVR
jgi:hypothetical protein